MLGGRYEVGELIGRGGMAEVHIGHDTRLGRTVAIKILRADLARDPSFQARFRREAQAAASLNHPAIVAVYDTGEDVLTSAAGHVEHVPFIVMEYVEGHTVREILRDGSAVPIEEAVEITSGVLSALEYSHHAGIVHRDIKPANVMLTATGAVKVMDFGIARAMADAQGTMTQTQAVIGTAQYLSPEQARGEAVDTRSDLYSTGCLLFELLTGRPPFIGDSPVAVAYQHAREVARPPSDFASDVPDPLDRITVKSLAKDREDRYNNAAEFRSDLENALRGGPVHAPAVGSASTSAAPGVTAATAVLGAGAIAGAAGHSAPTAAMPVVPADSGPPTASTQVFGAAGPAPVARSGEMPWEHMTGQNPVVPGYDTRTPAPVEEQERRPWLVWLLVGIAVAAVAGIILMLSMRGDGEPPVAQVTLPDLRNVTEAEARETIEGLDLEFKRVQEPDQLVPEGQVVKTDPQGPAQVDVGAVVTVTVSSGAQAVGIPDVRNFPLEQALAELEDAGFTNVVPSTEHHPTIPKDSVTSTDPAAGEQVTPDTRITVFASTGLVELESLVGSSEDEAREALNALGLSLEIQREESGEEPGTVLAQDRTGLIEQRATITLTVAEPQSVAETEVPDLFNLPRERAEERLAQASLNGEFQEEPSDEVQAGRVTRTDPPAGTTLAEGETIVVYLSTGPTETEGEGGGDGGD